MKKNICVYLRLSVDQSFAPPSRRKLSGTMTKADPRVELSGGFR